MNALVKLEGAVRMLAEAGTLEEVKHVHDLAILPACPGVYIVFDDAAVLYVGRSNNIKRRWQRHDRTKQIKTEFKDARILAVRCQPCELRSLEHWLIKELSPLLNYTPLKEWPIKEFVPVDINLTERLFGTQSNDFFESLNTFFGGGR